MILHAHQFFLENSLPNDHPHPDTIIQIIVVNLELLESEQTAQPCGVCCTVEFSEVSRSGKCFHVSVNPELPWVSLLH